MSRSASALQVAGPGAHAALGGAADGVVTAITDVRADRLIVVLDARGDHGYLVTAARGATAKTIALLSTHGYGVLRVAMPGWRLDELAIPPVWDAGGEAERYRAPVDLKGQPPRASDGGRAATVRALGDPNTSAAAFVASGHVFPVEVDSAGVLGHAGVSEAAFDLMRLAGAGEVALLTGAADEHGRHANAASATRLAGRLGLTVVAIDDVRRHCECEEPAVRRVTSARLPTPEGELDAVGFQSVRDGGTYVAFVHGVGAIPGARVHVHLRCQVADVFGGTACGCGDRLRQALAEIRSGVGGILLYVSRSDSAGLRHLRSGASPSAQGDEPLIPDLELGQVLRNLGVGLARLTSNERIDMQLLARFGVSTARRAG